MNYLAHIYLSGDDAELTAGNFIADSVKGEDHKHFPAGVQKGILLHRKIDDYTDHHPLVHQSKQYFVKQFDKYSGVLTDVFYDHFLARNFQQYSSQTLQDYAASRYQLLLQFQHLFPEKSTAFYGYMTGNNILVAYARVEGIERVLTGLTSRINNRALLYEAIPAFAENYTALENEFTAFFEELREYVADISSIQAG